MILQTTLDGHPIGSAIPLTSLGPKPAIDVVILGTAGLARLDMIRSGTVSSMPLQGERRFMGSLSLEDLQAGEYVYLRILQEDGSLAWTSPFFIE
jgi:hypothetical protein